MKIIYSLFLFLFAFSLGGSCSHISYTEMTYKSLGNGFDYEFTVTLYADCGVHLAPNSIQLNFCSISASKSGRAILDSIPGTGIPVFPLCSYPSSICIGGTNVGYKKHVYKEIISLPKACSDWVFTLDICCRSNLINTIETPGTEGSVIMLKLDNLHYPDNSSPTFNEEPIVFACINEEHEYDQSAIDIDGDSLSYSFYNPLSKEINCIKAAPVNYKGVFGLDHLVTTARGISLNEHTGKITMEPTIIERGLIGIRVDEYRNGQMIGSVYRDNMVTVTTERLLLGLKQAAIGNALSIHPNPANQKVEVVLNDGKGTLRLYNILGQLLLTQEIQTKITQLDVSNLSSGTYFAVLQTQSELFRKPFIKE